MKDNRSFFKAVTWLSYLTQLGLSIAAPILLCILAASWLQTRFALGYWVMLVAIVLGVGGGIVSLFNFIFYVQRQIGGKKK
ncbi:MAG: AtpZ/AtpI family protein [Oscillospiraceae bacterium]|nr:AtpZ/AtpI family protein [Oscillospiraceae bacterium]